MPAGSDTLVAPRGGDRYPSPLEELPDPPAALHWLGPAWPPPARAVAVVGTRAASAYGEEMAYRLAADLGRAGVTVVSGLARGIDAAAHAGALDAGGDSLALVAAAPERPYPPESASLHARLIESGAVASEFPAGTPLARGLFPRRNRLIAALSLVTVVVEAGARSGALSTARWCLRLGRPLAAVPGDVIRESAAGVLALLRDGARPVGDAGQVLALLDDASPSAAGEDPVLLALGSSSVTLESLARRLDRPARALVPRLTALELAGAVERRPGGRWRRRRGR